ncbi:CaiB/BaiF CoA-transferase family protein [Novosphingobium sp. BW1]|uniref:CaiB/BaiF CoA transferase family protein n=1 Tax=Novosphingobium sp. BW1 TaxID=2592621 RepID=UPI0011DEE82A|nr:CaiB/BaiF CoA-transferase family protein [Novosphingobium sp. BW1]TYC89651.1 CoA transferase [Novosphingobium sp. BW1]
MNASPTRGAQGPLQGLRVVEFLGIGPGPQAAMMLADLGAEVLRITRKGGNGWPNPVNDRGRAEIQIDIRSKPGRLQCLEALDSADVLIEGFRPGVMERLGLGPEDIAPRNPGLVYARMTGWGQDGPLARTAGHDINYIALSGALAAMGRPGEPAAIPLNLVGDFGGGSMLLLTGILAALFERTTSGRGQVVDAAILDGVTTMMSFFDGLTATGQLSLDRADNLLGGAAPYYRTYLCRDGREMSVGALEPPFFAELISRLDLPEFADGQAPQRWAALEAALTARFAEHGQAHWIHVFEGSDACVTPVLTLAEAKVHPHLCARETYVEGDSLMQAAPSPRFSRTPGAARSKASEDGAAMLARWREL